MNLKCGPRPHPQRLILLLVPIRLLYNTSYTTINCSPSLFEKGLLGLVLFAFRYPEASVATLFLQESYVHHQHLKKSCRSRVRHCYCQEAIPSCFQVVNNMRTFSGRGLVLNVGWYSLSPISWPISCPAILQGRHNMSWLLRHGGLKVEMPNWKWSTTHCLPAEQGSMGHQSECEAVMANLVEGWRRNLETMLERTSLLTYRSFVVKEELGLEAGCTNKWINTFYTPFVRPSESVPRLATVPCMRLSRPCKELVLEGHRRGVAGTSPSIFILFFLNLEI